ncbi:MAG: GNAT family N-acetyltransferase [Nocardioides sp.]|nr:GNAT family N-acetyltransferase [Nocardioides sp.]
MLADGYDLRPLGSDDAAALAAAYRRNREHLAPWDPVRSEEFFTAAGQQADLDHRLVARDLGLADPWVLWHAGEVVGRANLQNVVRGAMQGASIGYWVAADHVRRGLTVAMVESLCARALELGLHRVEAGTMLANVPSQRVLERAGFERIGVVPAYLFLAGAWQDHVLFQRLLHDEPLG